MSSKMNPMTRPPLPQIINRPYTIHTYPLDRIYRIYEIYAKGYPLPL
jgi:hypothetical protein